MLPIIGGSCHKCKKKFKRDESLVATNTWLPPKNTSFVATKRLASILLSRKLYLWRLPPMVVSSCYSRRLTDSAKCNSVEKPPSWSSRIFYRLRVKTAFDCSKKVRRCPRPLPRRKCWEACTCAPGPRRPVCSPRQTPSFPMSSDPSPSATRCLVTTGKIQDSRCKITLLSHQRN